MWDGRGHVQFWLLVVVSKLTRNLANKRLRGAIGGLQPRLETKPASFIPFFCLSFSRPSCGFLLQILRRQHATAATENSAAAGIDVHLDRPWGNSLFHH